jgi:hypothetical protein
VVHSARQYSESEFQGISVIQVLTLPQTHTHRSMKIGFQWSRALLTLKISRLGTVPWSL